MLSIAKLFRNNFIDSDIAVFLINDKAQYNLRYRKNVLHFAHENNISLRSIGVFDSFSSLIISLLKMTFFSRRVISSNLKTNILFLAFLRSGGVLILNGLGRFSGSRGFRIFIGYLLMINIKKKIFVQNYKDYRYFRRWFSKRIFWMPGSGGTQRRIGSKVGFFCISRDDKIAAQLKSLDNAIKSLGIKEDINFVGVTADKEDLLCGRGDAAGYVPQAEIFCFGSKFLQLDGYGEGIPHSLVDALITGLDAYIPRSQFRQFGLSRVGCRYNEIADGWGVCRAVRAEKVREMGEVPIAQRILKASIIQSDEDSSNHTGLANTEEET